MSYILHYTVTGSKEYENVAGNPRPEYIILVDGDKTKEELQEAKEDNAVDGFECSDVIDLEIDTDLWSLPTDRPLISST